MDMLIYSVLISCCAGLISSNRTEPAFVLYNRDYENGTDISSDLEDQNEPGKFINDLPCVFITHGWMRHTNTPSVQLILRAYLEEREVNAITVDWSNGSYALYTYASEVAVPEVGRNVGEFIIKLLQLNLCDPSTIHLIGHSLGAHVMGHAGRHVTEKMNVKIAKITGLDPAGPLFERDEKSRLQKSDADCVIAIHTDSGRFGINASLGHVDFYPNGGGPRQPECYKIQILCAHKKSFEDYAVSIKNETAFLATRCDSYTDYTEGLCSGNPTQYMGYPSTCRYEGIFYLTTDAVRVSSGEQTNDV